MNVPKFRAKNLISREWVEGYVTPAEFVVDESGVADVKYSFLSVFPCEAKMYADGKWHILPSKVEIDWNTLEEIKG